jgi:hypothetical protein
MKMGYISSTFLEYQSIRSYKGETRVLFSLVHGLDLLSSESKEIGLFQEYNQQMR